MRAGSGPLHEGRVDDQQVQCPWHQSTFSLEDGSILQGPATAPQPCYEVRLRDGAVEVRERRPVA
jgi:nitrite reductase/ring-hydroxylating ferredoxin subunit